MSKERNTSYFFIENNNEQFDIKKQGFLSIQEKKVFHGSKKLWLVMKQSLIIVGTTPRVVLDAYSNESAFLSGGNPKQTFNLTGTVAPVAICPQGHKQVRHVFAVCPPGSRFLFECDSQFGLESWVDELNMCLFPRNTGTDQILDDIQSSISTRLGGSFRRRTTSNSMNDLSKIGSEPVIELDSAPPLPPPNKKTPIHSSESIPNSPALSDDGVISKYKVEVEVSTLPQIPKGVCIIQVTKDDIQLCHAVTMARMVQWLITHIREFKLTNDDKLIITSGHRSYTGYGQIRLRGEACRPLYYKVKVFVQSKANSKMLSRKSPASPRACVTLPESSKQRQLPHQNRSITMDDDTSNYDVLIVSPPNSPAIISCPISPEYNQNLRTQASPKLARPLPNIPQDAEQAYDRLRFPKPVNFKPEETTYSKLRNEDIRSQRWSQGDVPTAKYLSHKTLSVETNYSNKYLTKNLSDNEYAVTNHGFTTPVNTLDINNADIRKLLDSHNHSGLLAISKEIRTDGNDFSNSYSNSIPYDQEIMCGELRKTKSLASANKDHKPLKLKSIPLPVATHITSYEDCTPPNSPKSDYNDSDLDAMLDDNPAYGKNPFAVQMNLKQTDSVSPYLVTRPELPPK